MDAISTVSDPQKLKVDGQGEPLSHTVAQTRYLQPSTRLPVLDISHSDQRANGLLGIRLVTSIGIGLGVHVPISLGTVLLRRQKQFGVVDHVGIARDSRPQESTIVSVDAFASGLFVTRACSICNTGS